MMVRRIAARLVLLVACAGASACAGSIVRPSVSPIKPASDALLVLPGFGYGGEGEDALKALAPAMAADDVDLYVPTYITRSGLADSRLKLDRFIREQRLDRYERVHVFAFIAGAWTLNPLMETGALPNLSTVVYDRSPLQERAPRIAADQLRVLTWVRYGTPVFDVAKTPYAPLTLDHVRVGLMVETAPTSFIRRREARARSYGPLRFECGAFEQRYDDCVYLPMSHNELYVRFAEIWPDLRTFMRTGRFSAAANRTTPTGDPFAVDRAH